MLQQRVEINTHQYFVVLDDELKFISSSSFFFFFFQKKKNFKKSLERGHAKFGISCFISSGKR